MGDIIGHEMFSYFQNSKPVSRNVSFPQKLESGIFQFKIALLRLYHLHLRLSPEVGWSAIATYYPHEVQRDLTVLLSTWF